MAVPCSCLRIARVASFVALAACGEKRAAPVPSAPLGPTPDSFRVAFETTRGRFVLDAHRRLAPLGVERLYELVAAGALDDNAFFRVVPGFIIQFGAPGDPKVNAYWDAKRIADDPPSAKNQRGTISFATDGPSSRTSQLFINLSDNAYLDNTGFVPVGRIVEGMSVVDSIYSAYREQPRYHLIATLGNSYLHRMFPKLDYITTARIIP